MSTPIDFRAVALELLAHQPASNLYFLLDHAGMPGLHRQLLRSSVEWSSLFDCSKEANAVEVAPFIVLAGSEGKLRMFRALFNWIGEHGTYSSSIVMLTSPLKMETLRNRLAARLDIRLSENMEAMMRFFDPRVLESLLRILPREQARTYFSPAETWHYVDRSGQLVSQPALFDPQEKLNAPLILSEEHEFALLESCEIDQVLDMLRENTPALIATLPVHDQAKFVNRAISTARQHGIDSVYKFSLCSAISLSQGENFLDGPQGIQFLDALKQDDFDSLGKIGKFHLEENRRQA